ncbi:MAG: family metallo-hydrolase [Actinomycetota bacterium]|nr:family metallo-hydrolase [Actinomycetota bacterium]
MSRFVRLCEISSPTGEERAIADAVRAELESFGLEVTEDDAAGPAGAGAGNLLTRIPAAPREDGSDPGYVMFCAHLDTVPHDGPIKVVLDDEEVYRSAGDTILGADNKAAVAVLMEMAARAAVDPPPIGLELLFTVAEEQGLLGAKAFDQSLLRSKVGFVLDHATALGEVITAAPTHIGIRADFKGVEAHAGLTPESGRSAIAAAARAVSEMKLGRIDDETTANIGLISGGTSGNVIPGHCRVGGEARSVDPVRVTEVIAEMTDAMIWSASESGCEVDVVTSKHFTGYRVEEESPALALAEEALQARGHEPVRVTTGGGSDANVFRERGMDCLLLANGTFDNHTADESVPRKNLSEMLAICEEIVTLAGARG